MDKSQKKRMFLFCALACLVYFTSYLTRKSYNASVLAIMDATGMLKTAVSLAVTGSFITYGVGQVISGLLGDKIRPRTMIAIGLLGASLCNAVIPFFPSAVGFAVVWSINGFFQSMIWPPLTRAMSENFSFSFYRRGSRLVVIAASMATVAVFGLVSLCAARFDWRVTFYITCLFGLAATAVWFFGDAGFEKNPVVARTGGTKREDTSGEAEKETKNKPGLFAILLASGAFVIIGSTMFCGVLRDGLETWTSSFLSDVYGMDTSTAILSVVILPLLSIASYYLAAAMVKLTKGVVSGAAVIWGFGMLSAFLLALFYRNSAVIGIAGMALLVGCAHAINNLLTVYTVVYFRKSGHVSTVSGFINAGVYVGSAVATYGIAGILEHTSWSVILFLLVGITTLGAVLSVLVIRRWNRFAAANSEDHT
ncbi:MAG: MFS transporter [Ruminococcus sp.]|nr:MFS transporter [Candidatus Apopatosoma intestinale]